MDKVALHVNNAEGNEFILRLGEAPDQQPPLKVAISGDISTIGNFLVKRDADGGGYNTQAVDKSKLLVLVDREARTILLDLDPENPYGAQFLGQLELSTELKEFKINEEDKNAMFTRERLIKLLRFNRHYFASADKHAILLSAYQTFNAQAFINMSASSDNRGNKSASYDKEIKTGLPEEFTLYLPIFKGQKKETFRVEICMDVTDGGAKFWFESVELKELIENRRDEIFQDQLKHCKDFVVIYR
jgi:hypothetical protein